MTPEEFLATTAVRLKADGNEVVVVDLPSGPATIGYQGKFRWRWLATKVNLFTVVSIRPEITAVELSVHISESIEYAKKTKGRLRGLQTGVAVLPILASNVVTSDAIELAKSRPVKGFAAITMPAVVDLSAGQSYAYTGQLILGAIYTTWLRERMMAAFGS
jgi:hypothetical protein